MKLYNCCRKKWRCKNTKIDLTNAPGEAAVVCYTNGQESDPSRKRGAVINRCSRFVVVSINSHRRYRKTKILENTSQKKYGHWLYIAHFIAHICFKHLTLISNSCAAGPRGLNPPQLDLCDSSGESGARDDSYIREYVGISADRQWISLRWKATFYLLCEEDLPSSFRLLCSSFYWTLSVHCCCKL